MILEKASQADFEVVCGLYEKTVAKMEADGNNQWHWGEYPNERIVAADIENGELWVVRREEKIIAAVAVMDHQEAEYDSMNWLFGVNPGVFHRLAVSEVAQHQGIGRKVLADIEEILRGMGCDCLRCDTYIRNRVALHLYGTNGMRILNVGCLYGHTEPHYAFEKPLTADCPLLPVPMEPSFRGGKLTPWGGEKLHTVFGKNIFEIPTGESLEASCIPGLESTDDQNVKLPEMIKRYGRPFAGRYANETFPLLLKIIDASEALSVQVHPDDSYAHDHENGKMGKTEAWLILSAEEGAELVYGIVPGTSRETLRAACEQGAAVSPLLRRVKVHPGDVCFIPSGCVHAIGPGIVLYEIQQSSDITYRFYDWDRVDKNGKKRELHLEKALAVTDLSFSLNPVPAPDQPIARILDTVYFTLDLIHAEDNEVELPPVHEFAFLTALDSEMQIHFRNGMRTVKKGQTYFVPCAAPVMSVSGSGRVAVSMPK